MAGSYSCCYVHPVVLIAVVDSYERRSEDARRVIGTLLGDRFACSSIGSTKYRKLPKNCHYIR